MSDEMSQAQSRRFALHFLLATGGMLIAVGNLNYWVDPSALHLPAFFTPVVQTSRAEKLRLMRELPEPPQGLILGSSRVLKLEPRYLQQQTGLTFFNAGVNYAAPEDHLAWLRCFIEQFGQPPAVLLLGIDPSSFEDTAPADPRLIAEPDLARQLPDFLTWEDRLHRWKALLSWQETKRSLRSLKTHLLDGGPPAPVEHYRPDGQIVYDQREAEIAEGTYDFTSALEFNQGEYLVKYQRFQTLGERRLACFRKLVELCRDQGTELVVFATPLHPQLARFLETETDFRENQQSVLAAVRSSTESHGFAFLDFSEIESFAGQPELFVDGVHPLEPNTRRMLDRILTGSSPRLQALVQKHRQEQLATAGDETLPRRWPFGTAAPASESNASPTSNN